jgi:hypothetical protein
VCESVPVGSGWAKVVAALVGWVAGAATAVAVGLFALSAINLQPGSQGGLPQIPAVTAGANPSPATSSPPSPAATQAAAPSSATSVERILTSQGGSVIARCVAAGAYLVSWSPAQGYKAEDVRRGPAGTAKLKFEFRDGGEYVVSVQCLNGIPQASVSREHW